MCSGITKFGMCACREWSGDRRVFRVESNSYSLKKCARVLIRGTDMKKENEQKACN